MSGAIPLPPAKRLRGVDADNFAFLFSRYGFKMQAPDRHHADAHLLYTSDLKLLDKTVKQLHKI